MDEDIKKELHILLGVIEGILKFLEEDGCSMALMLRDALFDQFWRVMEVLKQESPEE